MRLLLLSCLVAAACTKASKSEHRELTEPDIIDAGARKPPREVPEPCTKLAPPGPVRLGLSRSGPIAVDTGVLWLDVDGPRFLAASATAARVVNDAEADKLQGSAPEQRFQVKCDPGGCGFHGGGKAIYVVENGKERMLVQHVAEVHGVEQIGEYVYWVTYGAYGTDGELSRVPVAGGKVETLWSGSGIHEMLVDAEDLYLATESEVVRFDTGSSTAEVFTKDAPRPENLVIQSGHLFWTEHGDPSWKSDPNGAVRSVPLNGADLTTHAAEVRWPSGLHVDDTRIYWGREDGGELFAAPFNGGEVRTLADLGPGCGGIRWMHPVDAGMVVLRKSRSMLSGQPGEVWFVPLSH